MIASYHGNGDNQWWVYNNLLTCCLLQRCGRTWFTRVGYRTLFMIICPLLWVTLCSLSSHIWLHSLSVKIQNKIFCPDYFSLCSWFWVQSLGLQSVLVKKTFPNHWQYKLLVLTWIINCNNNKYLYQTLYSMFNPLTQLILWHFQVN